MSAHNTSSMHYNFTNIIARYSFEVSSLQSIYEPLRNTDSLIQFLSLDSFLIVHMLNAFCVYIYILVQKIYCTKNSLSSEYCVHIFMTVKKLSM
jgi:phenylalanine-4-hydroxylase